MEEQEKFDIINRISNSRPTNWKWRTDQKKFGWGSCIRKNRRCKVFGYGQGKEKTFETNSSDLLFVLLENGSCYSIPTKNITSKTTVSLGEKYLPYKVELF